MNIFKDSNFISADGEFATAAGAAQIANSKMNVAIEALLRIAEKDPPAEGIEFVRAEVARTALETLGVPVKPLTRRSS